MSESPEFSEGGAAGSAEGAVDLTVPAQSAFVSVLRTVTATLAARRDFTIEEIDDLRIAVDEASALLLPRALADSTLAASFTGPGDSLTVTVTLGPVDPAAAEAIDETSFAWMVLTALADEASSSHTDVGVSVTLSKTRAARV